MTKEYKLIYFDEAHPCCGEGYKSQETLLKEHAVVGTGYFAPIDSDDSKAWGDDWNDAPHCCNSGPPYAETVPGVVRVEFRLGEPIVINPPISKE